MSNLTDPSPDPMIHDGRWGSPPPEVARAEARAAERRRQIDSGEYEAVLGQFDRPLIDPANHERIWGEAHQALTIAAGKDPADFALKQLDSMVRFLGYLRLRAETSFKAKLAARDRAIASHGLSFDPGLDDPDLERIFQLFERLARLVEARASVARRLGLAARRSASPATCMPAGAAEEPLAEKAKDHGQDASGAGSTAAKSRVGG